MSAGGLRMARGHRDRHQICLRGEQMDHCGRVLPRRALRGQSVVYGRVGRQNECPRGLRAGHPQKGRTSRSTHPACNS